MPNTSPERSTGLRRVVAVALVLPALLAAGCGKGSPDGPRIIRVAADGPSIQDAVDEARPGDLVLIAPGTYHEAVVVDTDQVVIRGEDRNDVVLDGQDRLSNGIEVRSDQVVIENLTVRRYTVNGVIFAGGYGEQRPQSGPIGWRASYVTALNNGLYGLYAFGTGPGQFDHNYASGHPDSGIYVGQCEDCGAVVIDNVMELNAIGYENTNASGVTVARNIIRRNRVGVTIASADSEYLAPQVGGDIVANLVSDNDDPDAPVTEGGFGFGIVVAGGTDNRIDRNVITDHDGGGILLIDQAGYQPQDNHVTNNTLSANRIDLAFVAESGGEPTGTGNCFSDNRSDTSAPPDLEILLPCGEPSTSTVPPAELAFTQPPGSVDYRQVTEPGDQPNRPGRPDGRWEPGSLRPQAPSLDQLTAPTG